MKITHRGNYLVVHLGAAEKRLLLELLELYPRIPEAHQSLSKTTKLPEPDQHLLEEALAEQRNENKKHLKEFLADPNRCEKSEHGCKLALGPADCEWLLQVLNDVRVGSWVALGSPEPKIPPAVFNKQKAPAFWAMELAGYFQMRLLEAMEGAQD